MTNTIEQDFEDVVTGIECLTVAHDHHRDEAEAALSRIHAEVEELRGERDEALDDLARIRAEAASHKALAIENGYRVQTLEAARYWSDRDAQLRASLRLAASRSRAENESLREALDAIERLDTDYTVGSDENLMRARDIARAALAHPEGETP